MTITLAATVATMLSLGAFQVGMGRRREVERPLAAEWVSASALPSLALLPGSGAIVEANAAACQRFPDLPLLEGRLAQLFPAHEEAIAHALHEAARGSASALLRDGAGRATLLLLGCVEGPSRLLVATLTEPPEPLPLPLAAPTAPPLLPALPLPWESAALPAEQRLRALLADAVLHWPLRGAVLFQSQGMALRPLFRSGEPLPWEAFQLPVAQLGRLLHEAQPLCAPWAEGTLWLHPLPLPGAEGMWGVLALLPSARSEEGATWEAALAALAWQCVALLGQARASHQRSQQGEALQEQQELAAYLLERSPRPTLLLDAAGTVVALNGAASRLLSWPSGDVVGRRLDGLLEGMGSLRGKLQEALAQVGGSSVVRGQGRFDLPGRAPQPIAFSVERVGGRVALLCLFLDDQREGPGPSDEVRHLGQLAVLGKKAAMIAHDLRNPLASILMGLESIAESLGPTHPDTEGIQMMLEDGERVRGIIEDILASSRQPSLTIRLCELRSLLNQVLDSHERPLRERRIHVRRYYEPTLPMIEGDPVRLSQLFDNLVSNAIEALPEGGQLEAVLRPLSLEQLLLRGLNPDVQARLQGGVELLLRDNGPGIPAHLRDQIFEPLFTTKGSGTGLGLAIVRTIVGQHRGYLFLESEVGVGTTFQIFLPQLSTSSYGA